MRTFLIVVCVLTIPSFIFFYGWGESQADTMSPLASAEIEFPSGRTAQVKQAEYAAARQDLLERTAEYMTLIGKEPSRQSVEAVVSEREAVDHAIELEILKELAQQYGITVTEEDAIQVFEEQLPPQFRTPEGKAQVILELRQRGQTVAEVISSLQYRLLIDRVRSVISAQSRISYYEAWLHYQLQNEKLVADYVRFSAADYRAQVDSEAAADAAKFGAAVNTYFEANKEKYRVPDQVEYRYMLVTKDSLRSEVLVTDDEITSYYTANREQYRQPRMARLRQVMIARPMPQPGSDPSAVTTATEEARARADDLKSRITKGESFEALADEFNEESLGLPRETDPETTAGAGIESVDALSTAGGNLGLISEGVARIFYGDEWTSSVFELQPGIVSPVIESPRGFHIVKADEVRPGLVQDLEKVRPFVEQRIVDTKVEQVFREVGDDLFEKARIHTSLDSLAEATSRTVAVTAKVDKRAEFIPGIGLVGDFREALGDLEKGGRSDLLTDANRHLVIEIQEEYPAHDPELTSITARVEADYKSARSIELAREAAQNLAQAAKSADGLSTAAQATGLETTRTQPFERSEVGDALGNIANFEEFSKGVAVGDVAMSATGEEEEPTGFVVWALAEKQSPSQADFAAALPEVVRELTGRRALTLIREYLRDQKAELGSNIKISESYR